VALDGAILHLFREKRERLMTTFTVIKETGYGYIVADASITAKSFAMIPAHHQAVFPRRYEAEAQPLRLSGQTIELRMIDTPARFEAAADTTYGPEW
jgi:hypothetical protein